MSRHYPATVENEDGQVFLGCYSEIEYGFCAMCYAYHRDPDRARSRRKAKRLASDVVAKRYPKVREWHVQNAEHVRQYKRRWHEANTPPRWPVGMPVWYELAGFWCAGVIVERPNKCTIVVQLKGGTIVRTSARSLLRAKPAEAA